MGLGILITIVLSFVDFLVTICTWKEGVRDTTRSNLKSETMSHSIERWHIDTVSYGSHCASRSGKTQRLATMKQENGGWST